MHGTDDALVQAKDRLHRMQQAIGAGGKANKGDIPITVATASGRFLCPLCGAPQSVEDVAAAVAAGGATMRLVDHDCACHGTYQVLVINPRDATSPLPAGDPTMIATPTGLFYCPECGRTHSVDARLALRGPQGPFAVESQVCDCGRENHVVYFDVHQLRPKVTAEPR